MRQGRGGRQVDVDSLCNVLTGSPLVNRAETVLKQQLNPSALRGTRSIKRSQLRGEHGLRVNSQSTILQIIVKHSTIAYHYKTGTNIKFDWKPHARQTILKRIGHMFGWKPRLR